MYSKYIDQACKEIILLEKLPPSCRAGYFHGLTSHYQIMLWSLIDEDGTVEIVATDWGWKMQNGTLVPVMTDQDIAPDSLTNIIRCKCNVSKIYFYHLKILLSSRISTTERNSVEDFSRHLWNTTCDLRLEFVKCKSSLGTSDIVFGVILYFSVMLKLPHLHVLQIEYSMKGKFCFYHHLGVTSMPKLWQNDIFLILIWNNFMICRIMQLILGNRRYENVHYDVGLCRIEIPTVHV